MVRRFVKRHVLLVGFLAVLVPLGVMLSLQYGWLSRLQETSAIAEKASLSRQACSDSGRTCANIPGLVRDSIARR